MTFLIAVVLLVLVVLALFAWPSWRRSRSKPQTDTHRRLVAELNDDVAAGVLPAEDKDVAVLDLDLDPVPAEPAIAVSPRPRRWAWLALALVPLVAVVLYWQVGNWRAGIEGDRAAVLHRADTMLTELRAHLKTHPQDQSGWVTLGRADSALGNYSDAAAAYEQAVKLDNEQDPELLALWGEALVLADPAQLTDQERSIFAVVLKADPNNVRGLWYGGLLALADGDTPVAVAHWQRLLGQKIPAPMAAFVRSRLTQLGAAATAAAPIVAVSGPTLKLTVKLAPELAPQLKPDETLFVFVQAAQGGPPFAVRRVTADHFPVTVTLDDDDAMLAGHDLSHADGPIEIVARLSRNGEADPQPGDLFGTRRLTLAPGDRALTITINRRAGAAAD